MKNVVLLGSTGSIGTSTVKVAEDLPERIRLIALAAGNNSELLLDQTRKHQPAVISINDPAKARELRKTLGTTCEVFSGAEGLLKLLGLTQYGPEQIDFLRYRPVLDNRRLKEEFGYAPKLNSSQVFELWRSSRRGKAK